MTNRLPGCLPIDKLERILRVVAADSARLVAEGHAIALVGNVYDLGSEGRADELCAGLLGQRLQQLGHGCSVLSIKVGINLVKNNKRAALSTLERENEAKSTQT